MPLWIPLVFFFIALGYSTVGFGGGSSYLAVLALAGLPYQTIPQTALICNLLVSGGGAWHFRRGGHFGWRNVFPFLALSMPMAYVGGRIPVGERLFFLLLGVSLLAAGARLFVPGGRPEAPRGVSTSTAWLLGLPVGAALGFLAGLVGIGGGIFLAPILLLSGWAGAKETAAASSVFILLNSAAGLTGQFAKGIHVDQAIVPLGLAVVLGGQIGSRLGAYRLPVVGLRRLLALLIVAVSVRLIWRAI